MKHFSKITTSLTLVTLLAVGTAAYANNCNEESEAEYLQEQAAKLRPNPIYKIPADKTVAAIRSSYGSQPVYFVSGWKDGEFNKFNPSISQIPRPLVRDWAIELGYNDGKGFSSAGKKFDHGVEGAYRASHSETQALFKYPDANHIGVSAKNGVMCESCQKFVRYFTHFRKHGALIIRTDKCIYRFKPSTEAPDVKSIPGHNYICKDLSKHDIYK